MWRCRTCRVRFAATQDQIVWVLTSYIVAAAISIPLTGWLATRFDRKKVFLISIAGFTVTSALCGMSLTLRQIVLFRLLQGVSGAALVPLSQAILFDINPPENHGRAMAFWGIGVTLGPILGPALGGWLTENYNWRWVFYINLPIGILAFLGLLFFLPSSKDRQANRFDFFGFIALSVAVGSLQIMLDRGGLKDWFSSPEIITEGIVTAVAFYLFIIHTATHKRPFINIALFADANFLIGNVIIFIMGVVMFATLALLPPMLQEILNYPVITTGLVTAPRGMGLMLAMIVVGRLVGRIDTRILMGLGILLTAISLQQMVHFSILMDAMARNRVGVFARIRHRVCLYTACNRVFFNPADKIAYGRHGFFQPASQSRQQYRHFGRAGSFYAEHADCPCWSCRTNHTL